MQQNPEQIMEHLVELEKGFRLAHSLGTLEGPYFQIVMMLIDAFKMAASEIELLSGRIDELEAAAEAQQQEPAES